ncbi:MAG: T9SS type A sorting domain-containing protein [Bacteroidetes bacterium]|nr:T9SS type A sorting domain-containing protein [Bacteroidota bacterium]
MSQNINKRKISCRMIYVALPILLFFATIANAQYCPPTQVGACFGYQIEDFSIAGTTLTNLGTGCAALTGTAYTFYPATGNTTANLEIGQTYQVLLKCSYMANVSVWIDYDHNYTFDANEWTLLDDTTIVNFPSMASITIPAPALTGNTRMRIRSNFFLDPNGPLNACSSFDGETEDYTVNLIQGSGCSGVPVAGAVSNLNGPLCAVTTINLKLTGCPYAPSYSYQWESSPDNINWSLLSGANYIAYNGKQTNDTYYRCVVKCGAFSDTTAALLVPTINFVYCFCSSAANVQTGGDIGNVNFLTLNNGVGTPAVNNMNSAKKYTDFTGLSPITVTQGISNPMTITQITSGSVTTPSYIDVYIDHNHNAIFDSDEHYAFGNTTNANNILSRNVVIPYTSLTGITKMRIVLIEIVNGTQSSCGTYFKGETEDYLINVLQGSACISPPQAGTAYAVNAVLCTGDTAQVSMYGFSNGVGQSYQWQSSTDNLNWMNISGTNDTMYSALIAGPVYYHCVLTCGGISSVSTSMLVQNNSVCSYCTNNLGGDGCFISSNIDRVKILNTPFNNNSVNTCNLVGASPYNVYTAYPLTVSTTATLLRTQSYTIEVSVVQNGLPISAWIDYNQDGQFSNSEYISIDTMTSFNYSSVVFTVPAGIPIGTTRMRVRSGRPPSPPFFSPNYACTFFNVGETEDFFVSIDFPTKLPSGYEGTQLNIWPNPASKELKISLPNSAVRNTQIKLLNLAGQTIFEEQIIQNSNLKESVIDVSHIIKGIYFLQVILQGEIINRKIIIE